MAENLREGPLEPNVKKVADFMDLSTSQWSSGFKLPDPIELEDGSVLNVDYWRYREGEKGEIDTGEASVPADELIDHAERLLVTGKPITMITGSSDDTLSVRISIWRPANNLSEAEAAEGVRSDVRSSL